MSHEPWPSPHQPPSPALPRVEDLSGARDGYDRQQVRDAFDAFYRHAAQLDAALRTLEAVDAFQRTASDLRADLRAIRTAGFTAATWQRPYAEPRARRPILPESLPRIAAEVAFLIAVAVGLGVAGWGALPVIGVMALALVIVWAVEWLAANESARPVGRRPAARRPAVAEAAPGDEPEAPASTGWTAFAPPDEERADAMTMVEQLPGARAEEAVEAAAEPEAPAEAASAAAIGEAVAPDAFAEPDGAHAAEAEDLEASAADVEAPAEQAAVVDVGEVEPRAAAVARDGDQAAEREDIDVGEAAAIAPAEAGAHRELEPSAEAELEHASTEPEPPAAEASSETVPEGEPASEPAAEAEAVEEATPVDDLAEIESEAIAPEGAMVDAPGAEELSTAESLETEPRRRSLWQRIRGRAAEPEAEGELGADEEPQPVSRHVRVLGPDEIEDSREEDTDGMAEAVARDQTDAAAEEPAVPEGEVVSGAEAEALQAQGPEAVEEPEAVEGEPSAEPQTPRRRFWQRRRDEAPEVFRGTVADADAALAEEGERVDELAEEELAAASSIDPWEREFELPVEAEPAAASFEEEGQEHIDPQGLDDAVEQPEAISEPDLAAARLEPEETARDVSGGDAARSDLVELTDRQEDVDADSEAEEIVALERLEADVLERELSAERESAEADLDAAGAQPEARESQRPEPPEELPIEVLAEQAAAALERSRARRRQLRRARRR